MLRIEIDHTTASALAIKVDPGEQIRPPLRVVRASFTISKRQRAYEQLRVFIKGHARWRESHPVGHGSDVQVAQPDPETVLAVDATGFRADLLAGAQQRRVFWEIVAPAEKEWLFFNKCELVDPKPGTVRVSMEDPTSPGIMFC